MATLTNLGLERRARRGFADAYSPFAYMALGRDTKAEANDDSTLGDEITDGGAARALATLAYEADYKATWVKLFTITDTFAITELAIFDNATLKVIEDCEDIWDEYTDAEVTASADADCKVGTKSCKLVVTAAAEAGDLLATEVITSANLTTYEYVNMWIKSSVALDSGDMQLLLDNTAQCASPIKLLDVPAIGADAWTLVQMDLGDASGLTAVISVGIKQIEDKGAVNLFFDSIHCPGTILMRHKFSAVHNVGNGDTVQFTCKQTESRA